MKPTTVLWRRLDTPGHDACSYRNDGSGFELDGTAVFLHQGAPARLDYRVACDGDSRTRNGSVRGFVGDRAVEVKIERTADGVWTVDDRVVPGLERLVHLDLGFTPATNFPQLRQLSLGQGEAAELPVVWMDVPPSALRILPQRYERRGETKYWYQAPSVPYAALLALTPDGFVRRFPGLWENETDRE